MHNSALSRLGYHNLKASFKSFGNIASNILVVSLKKADAYYTAMEARCFDGDLNFLQEEKKLDKKHLITAVLFILSMFAIWFISSKLDFLYAL